MFNGLVTKAGSKNIEHPPNKRMAYALQEKKKKGPQCVRVFNAFQSTGATIRDGERVSRSWSSGTDHKI